MGNAVSGVNPKILSWARERAGMTIAQVAAKMKRSVEEIEAWESEDRSDAPTYPQLERLASDFYKRPVALFFFPEPPEEKDPEHSFRTLPDFEIDELTSNTRYKIRHAHALQLSLSELSDGVNSAKKKIFVDLHLDAVANPATVAERVREYLGITFDQQRGWKDPTAALKAWRDAVEEKGVFVFKDTFKQREVSGFCLYDDEFPIIYVNNSTAVTRQIFTILHELGHILLGSNGITKRDVSYIGQLEGAAKQVEIFCNQFAGECLLPSALVDKAIATVSDEAIATLAMQFKVSRQVVLSRLISRGRVTQAYYDEKSKEWAAEYDPTRGDDSGGNYYATQGAYFGERFLRLAFQRYYENRISVQQLAEHLNVKAANIPGIEQLVLQRPSNS